MTFPNVGLLESYQGMVLHGTGQTVFLARTGNYEIKKRDGHYLSFMPWKTATISIEGVKYPLDRHSVHSAQALTVSNEWSEERALLTVHEGMVLVMLVKK